MRLIYDAMRKASNERGGSGYGTSGFGAGYMVARRVGSVRARSGPRLFAFLQEHRAVGWTEISGSSVQIRKRSSPEDFDDFRHSRSLPRVGVPHLLNEMHDVTAPLSLDWRDVGPVTLSSDFLEDGVFVHSLGGSQAQTVYPKGSAANGALGRGTSCL